MRMTMVVIVVVAAARAVAVRGDRGRSGRRRMAGLQPRPERGRESAWTS